MKETPFRKGDPLLADDLEGRRQAIMRVLKVAPPLQLSNTATGIYVSTAGGGANIGAGVFTTINSDSLEYPAEGDDPCPYLALQDLSPTFVEEFDGAYSNDSTTEETWIFNLSSDHIPTGTRLVALKINGQWFTYYRAIPASDIVEGELTTTLSVGGTATLALWDADGEETGVTVTVRDRAGWAGSIGMYCMAIRIDSDYSYRPIVLGCTATEV